MGWRSLMARNPMLGRALDGPAPRPRRARSALRCGPALMHAGPVTNSEQRTKSVPRTSNSLACSPPPNAKAQLQAVGSICGSPVGMH